VFNEFSWLFILSIADCIPFGRHTLPVEFPFNVPLGLILQYHFHYQLDLSSHIQTIRVSNLGTEMTNIVVHRAFFHHHNVF